MSDQIHTDLPINDTNQDVQGDYDGLDEKYDTLKKQYEELVGQYRKLKEINHHNYILIGKMKQLIIEKGELQDDERKLGGVEMIERAFARKNEQIRILNEQILNYQHNL